AFGEIILKIPHAILLHKDNATGTQFRAHAVLLHPGRADRLIHQDKCFQDSISAFLM
ncbi:hypothetical protein HispidOSU_019660, partial [Sigmodon hispidus]